MCLCGTPFRMAGKIFQIRPQINERAAATAELNYGELNYRLLLATTESNLRPTIHERWTSSCQTSA